MERARQFAFKLLLRVKREEFYRLWLAAEEAETVPVVVEFVLRKKDLKYFLFFVLDRGLDQMVNALEWFLEVLHVDLLVLHCNDDLVIVRLEVLDHLLLAEALQSRRNSLLGVTAG